MKQQKLMTRIICALALATMLAFPTGTLRAQSSDAPTTASAAASGGGSRDLLERLKLALWLQLEIFWGRRITPVLPPGKPPTASTEWCRASTCP